MEGAQDQAAYRRVLEDMEAVPLAARRLFLRDRRPLPLERNGSFCNAESLRMALAASRVRDRVTIGRVHRGLRWSRQVCSHVLRWGVRQGYLQRTATSTYRIILLPPLGETSSPRRP